jgi:hypothetical protein
MIKKLSALMALVLFAPVFANETPQEQKPEVDAPAEVDAQEDQKPEQNKAPK